MSDKRIAFVASDSSDAQAALRDLTERYKGVRPEEADIVVALGGDGFMLRILHDDIAQSKPIFGINRGSVGFLMNEYRLDDLERRLSRAEPVSIRPLRMTATTVSGEVRAKWWVGWECAPRGTLGRARGGDGDPRQGLALFEAPAWS